MTLPYDKTQASNAELGCIQKLHDLGVGFYVDAGGAYNISPALLHHLVAQGSDPDRIRAWALGVTPQVYRAWVDSQHRCGTVQCAYLISGRRRCKNEISRAVIAAAAGRYAEVPGGHIHGPNGGIDPRVWQEVDGILYCPTHGGPTAKEVPVPPPIGPRG